MKNKDRVPLFVVFLMGCISMLLIAADTVQPGKPISQYPRATDFQGTDIFIIARTNVSPATNLGVTGNILSNFIATVVTNNIKLVPGTNVTITTNVSSGVITYTISVTNAGNLTTLSNNLVALMTNHVLVAGTNIVVTSNLVGNVYTWTIATITNISGSGGGDTIWTNDQGVVHFTSTSGKLTNDFQIHTNGAVSLGKGAVPFWLIEAGGEVGVGGESFVGVRSVTLGDIDWNEWLIGLSIGTTNVTQDHFMNSEINRRTMKYLIGTNYTFIDEYVEGDGNVVYSAVTNGLFIWNFSPNRDNAHAYVFDTLPRVVPPDLHIVEFNNNDTNMMALWGDGKLAVQSQITNYFLSTNKFVMTDVGKGLVSSQFGEDDFNQVATTNYVNCTITNQGFATETFVSNYVANINLATNFINLSVQAAKLPESTNTPVISAAYREWMLMFYKTNDVGTANAEANATWQFVVPIDFDTSSGIRALIQTTLMSTNGPNTSNIIWGVSFFKATPDDAGNDITTNAYSAEVFGTNTITASQTNTFRLFKTVVDVTVPQFAPGDLGVFKLRRSSTNDTYMGTASVVGLQLLYAR